MATTNRQHAFMTMQPTYEGRACTYCGGTERRTSNGNCVACSNRPDPDATPQPQDGLRAANSDARQQALASGVHMYNRFTPCPKCEARGVREYRRYTSNGGCVGCQMHRSEGEAAKRRAALASDKPNPLMPIPSGCKHGAMLAKILPQLNGQTLAYAHHPFSRQLDGDKPRLIGKCALCHPNKLITMCNMLQWGTGGGLSQECGHWMYMMHGTAFPGSDMSLTTIAMAEYNDGYRARHSKATAPAPMDEAYSPPPLSLPFDS